MKDLWRVQSGLSWHGLRGRNYAKGGKGIENSPFSLRGKGGYGANCSVPRNISREKSKGEISALYQTTKRK